jgi:hypothetical protein
VRITNRIRNVTASEWERPVGGALGLALIVGLVTLPKEISYPAVGTALPLLQLLGIRMVRRRNREVEASSAITGFRFRISIVGLALVLLGVVTSLQVLREAEDGAWVNFALWVVFAVLCLAAGALAMLSPTTTGGPRR